MPPPASDFPASRPIFSNAYLLLAITTLLWGGNAIAARLAVGHISPMVLTAGRWFVVLVIIALFLRAPLREAMPVLRRHWLFALVMGMLGYTFFNALMYVAGHYTSAVNITLLQGSIPVSTMIGAYLVFGSRITWLQIIGILLTLVGVAVTASGGDPARLMALAFNFGDLLMVIASVLYAVYTVLLNKRPPMRALAFYCGMAIAAALASMPFLIAEILMDKSGLPTLRGWLILAYVAVGPSLISQILFMRAVELVGPARAGLFTNLTPVFGALLAVLILGEHFGWHHAVSMALVIGGIAIAEKGRSR